MNSNAERAAVRLKRRKLSQHLCGNRPQYGPEQQCTTLRKGCKKEKPVVSRIPKMAYGSKVWAKAANNSVSRLYKRVARGASLVARLF